jgi:ERF superfamily
VTETKPKTLHRKLFLARKAAKAVPKRGYNHDGDYYFARFEDVMAEASAQLEKRGILVIPQMVDEELIVGRLGVIAKAVIEYEVTDTEGDESLKLRWAGTGHDEPGDKALFKATTGTSKYFLASLLGIPFGTDPEEDSPAAEADQIRREQDTAADEPDEPTIKPLPESDLPEPDWSGLALGSEVGADV